MEEAGIYTPSHAAKITGIPEDTITALAKDYALAKPASIRLGYGIDRWYYSDCTARAIAMLARLKEEEVIDAAKRTQPYDGFKERTFATPSGRIDVYKEDQRPHGSALPVYREPLEATPDNPKFASYPLVLLSAHSRYRIHSTVANMKTVQAREPDPIVRISPDDAASRGIADGDVVRVHNDRGHVTIKCKIDPHIRPGAVLIAESHWIDQFIDGDPYTLTHDNFSETAQNYAQYDVLVEVARS